MRGQIMQSGEVACCDFCGLELRPTIELDELAEQVHSVLKKHFFMTSPEPEDIIHIEAAKEGYWEQPGDLVTDVIIGLIDSSEKLAESVRECLSDKYDPWGKDAMIDPCPYASDSQYEGRAIGAYKFQESWSSFRQEILFRSRFFNQSAKSALDHLFQGVALLVTHTGDPVVRVLSPSDSIFRARLAKSDNVLEEILKATPKSLGAPSGLYANAGRMNAEGISVFYGATDKDTCIAEIRAPVGGYVVIGQFLPLRELRLLDLTRLRKVFLAGSLFDSEHTQALSRVHFLKQLEAELSQPVMPGSESRDYLPTQVVAEYLGTHPDMELDGIVFASSQIALEEGEETDTEEQQGKNVVLFSHACGLKGYDLPYGTEIDVRRYFSDPDDLDHSMWFWEKVSDSPEQEENAPPDYDDPDDLGHGILIWEKVPDNPEQEENAPPVDGRFGFGNLMRHLDSLEVKVDASIQLDMESIEVRRVKGVSYQTFPYNVSRHRI